MMTEERNGSMGADEEATASSDEQAAEAEDRVAVVEALRSELEETRQQFLRARADYQNLERRSREERQEFGRYQLISLVLNVLPVLDDLERAIEASDGQADEAWLEGVRLVEQKFRGVLEAAGVAEIDAVGEAFDPERHEATGTAPGPEGQVVHLLRRGYTLQGRVIRPAMVLVGTGAEAGVAAAPDAHGPETHSNDDDAAGARSGDA